jgi:hypothetical protein
MQGIDLYNLQVLYKDKTAPSEVQLASIYAALKFFNESVYEIASLKAKNFQYKRKLQEIYQESDGLKRFIDNIEEE